MNKDGDILLQATLEKARKLGPEFEQVLLDTLFTVHHPGLRRGRILTVREAKALKVGDVVWMRYREYEEPRWRVDEAVEIMDVIEPGHVETDVGGFRCTNDDDDDPAVDEDHGLANLSVAEPIPTEAPPPLLDPASYTRGKPMTSGFARLLLVGDVVWIRYRKDEDGSRELWIDGPERVRSAFNGTYVGFETTDFFLDDLEGGEGLALDTTTGTMSLWHARKKRGRNR